MFYFYDDFDTFKVSTLNSLNQLFRLSNIVEIIKFLAEEIKLYFQLERITMKVIILFMKYGSEQ